jgi:hypothetical protein
LSESLSIGPGLGWFSEIDGGSSAFPILLIDWKITDKWRLNTGRGLAASQGPGLTLNYQLAERWPLGLIGRYEKTRFALGDNPLRAATKSYLNLPSFPDTSVKPFPPLASESGIR